MPNRRSIRAASLFALLFAVLTAGQAQEYVLLGWNDLGMHCSNKYFSKVVVLPPFNNVSAQLVERSADGTTRLVTAGVTVNYAIPDNTFSVGKTDFWTYAQTLFGLPTPLPDNIGLTGKGLSGVLETNGSSFAVHGVPITPFADSDLVHEAPFQLIHLEATRDADGRVLASTDAVIPVSNEVGCVQSGCHASETSILNNHPGVTGFNRSGPVLCASCHASNALGTTGQPSARSFSYRMHEKHAEVAGPSRAISTCYKCHPGPNTQCLRDIMGKNPTNPMVCQDCHGTMKDVAETISNGRRPWFDEPQCGSCHGSAYAEEPGKLFRQSKGHGGLYCSACHGSPHAIQPTVQANDNLQNIRLQGYAGTLAKCSVCHATPPSGPGPHGIVDTSAVAAADAPVLSLPADGALGTTLNPVLQWAPAARASHYEVQIGTDALLSSLVADDSTLSHPWFSGAILDSDKVYYWRARGWNAAGAGAWSATWSFTTSGTLGVSFDVLKTWNLVSLPVRPADASVPALFPSATTSAYSYSALGGYAQSSTLTPGKAYWLRFPAAMPVSMTGQAVTAETVAVEPGWNLVGAIRDSVPVGAVRTVPDGILGSAFFGYGPGYAVAATLAPGHGYWVNASAPGVVIVSAAAAAAKASRAASDDLAGADMIVLRDALGREQRLYLSGGTGNGTPRSWYAMPPLPPAGVFDARFTSGLWLEPYPAPGAPEPEIVLNNAVPPLVVRWHAHAGSPWSGIVSDGARISVRADGEATIASVSGTLRLAFDAGAALPGSYALAQNYPNPFNPTTTIGYSIPSRSEVRIAVYGISGELVSTLFEGMKEGGNYEASWSPMGASGIYFVRMEATDATDPSVTFRATRKVLYLR